MITTRGPTPPPPCRVWSWSQIQWVFVYPFPNNLISTTKNAKSIYLDFLLSKFFFYLYKIIVFYFFIFNIFEEEKHSHTLQNNSLVKINENLPCCAIRPPPRSFRATRYYWFESGLIGWQHEPWCAIRTFCRLLASSTFPPDCLSGVTAVVNLGDRIWSFIVVGPTVIKWLPICHQVGSTQTTGGSY